MADERIELTDLDVIARYSLAVRAATADREELIETLRSDLEWLEGLPPAPRPAPAPADTPATPRKAAARKAPARKAATKKAARR